MGENRGIASYPNWFADTGQKLFEQYLQEFVGEEVTMLQIGAFTGDASVWLAENILTHPGALLIDVDTWRGSDEDAHLGYDWSDVERTYKDKVAPHGERVVHFVDTSDHFFSVEGRLPAMDFVYIDGDHSALQVLRDAINAFEVLRVGGILAFDDYEWISGKGRIFDPCVAINSFRHLFADYIEVLHVGYQVWCRKISEIKEIA